MCLSYKFQAWMMAALTAISLSACHTSDHPDLEHALYSCDLFTVYPDSLVSRKLTLKPEGNELHFVTPHKSWSVALDDGLNAATRMAGSDTLLNYLFNRHIPLSSFSYTVLTPYEIWLVGSLLAPHDALATLADRLDDGEVLQPESGLYGWPVVGSDAAWAIAAREIWLATGNVRWRNTSAGAIDRMLAADRAYAFDRSTGLYTGVPADFPIELLPAGYNAADIASIRSLQSNVNRFVALDYLSAIAGKRAEIASKQRDSLAIAIVTMLWMPEEGRFSDMLYQTPFPIQSAVSDNLSQALAITAGITSPTASRYIVSRTPLSQSGIPLRSPSDPRLAPDPHRQALTAALWTLASARASNEKAFALSLASLCYMASSDTYASTMLQGAVMRSIFGMSLTPEGIAVNPFIPSALGPDHSLTFNYRDASISLVISGRGNVISTFSIDGRVTDSHLIPADLSGQHEIRVNLSGFSATDSTVTLIPLPDLLPTPEVNTSTTSPRSFTVSSPSSTVHSRSGWLVYVNGVLDSRLESDSYTLAPSAPASFVAFVPFGPDGEAGIAAPPSVYIPEGDSIFIPASDVAETGSRIFKDKKLAKQFVESRRFHNPDLTFTIHARQRRECWLEIEYVNGLGIVNPGLRYAMRTLSVNGSLSTLMVLPQLSPESWRHDIEWWRRTGSSIPVPATLEEGDNTVTLSYFKPSPTFDDDSNILIPIGLRVIFK